MRLTQIVVVVLACFYALSAYAQDWEPKKIETMYGTFQLIYPLHTGIIITPKGNMLLGGMCGCQSKYIDYRNLYQCQFEGFVEHESKLYFIMTSEVWQYDPLEDRFKIVLSFGCLSGVVGKRFDIDGGSRTFFTLIPKTGYPTFRGLLYYNDGFWEIARYIGPSGSRVRKIYVDTSPQFIRIEGDEWKTTFHVDMKYYDYSCENQSFKTSIGDFYVVTSYGEYQRAIWGCSTPLESGEKYQSIVTPEGAVGGMPIFLSEVIGITETPEGIFLITKGEIRRYVSGAFVVVNDFKFHRAFALFETDVLDVYLAYEWAKETYAFLCGGEPCLMPTLFFYSKDRKKWVKFRYP